MSERVFHEENLARIENRIAELRRKIWGLQERMQILETAKFNTEATYSLLVLIIDHLEVMERRRQLTLHSIYEGQVIGKTGCRQGS